MARLSPSGFSISGAARRLREEARIMTTAQTFLRLQPAFDALALLMLQPETESAPEALRLAAQCVLEAGGDRLSDGTKRALEAASRREAQPLALSQAYAKLFLGVGPTTVPLTESAWTSAQRLLCQAAQIECRKAYEDAGLELSGGSVVPEDHVGLMLGFLSVMALREEPEAGLAFFSKHLEPLIAALAEAVRARAGEGDAYADVVATLEALRELLAA